MFLVDDLLLAPFKGMLWVFGEIHDAAQQELDGEKETITAALSELYMKLETGQLTETEFDAQEKVLLDRLDILQAEEESAAPVVKKPIKRRPRVKRSRTRPPAPVRAATTL
jgi:Gas vesicle protein G